MPMRISDEKKLAMGLGTGEGAYYRSFITTAEFNSCGTACLIRDWITGRHVHCLSQGEGLWYYVLRWDNGIVDVREQYPLNKMETERIADELGIKHPAHVMTTDFLATRADGSHVAYAVKYDRRLGNRKLELLAIEKEYWTTVMHYDFEVLFTEDLDRTLAHNIRLVTGHYDPESVFDETSRGAHLIATKQVSVDMSSHILDRQALQDIAAKN